MSATPNGTCVAELGIPVPRRHLTDIAAGLASVDHLWRPLLTAELTDRSSVRLLATERYEAWLLQWDVGHGVELHDHGGAAGALVVVEGRLVEVDGVVGCPRRRVISAGSTRSFGPELIHDVLNVGPGRATSIHVYSPPLSSMTFYDPATLAPLRTDRVVAETPALLVDPATILHPAQR
ncbi:MAG: hypothetical protein QOH64_1016 [Acidimicrobiaceae bacterium]|jgi:hypothetical protein